MKKIMTLLLIVCMMILQIASCAPSVNTGDDTDVSTENGASDNTLSDFDELGFAIFPEGNYLADKKFDTDEYLPDYDSLPAFSSHYGTSGGKLFAETEDTWYYAFRKNSDLIMYKDKATGIGGPLCGKPECSHDNASCNAYETKGVEYSFTIYDGKLYGCDNYSITSRDLDGTNREVTAFTGGAGVSGYMGHDIYAVIHRGYIYYCGGGNSVVDGVADETLVILAQPMDGGGGEVIFYKTFTMDNTYNTLRIKLIGNDLYVFEYHCDNTNYQANHWETVDVYRWDTKTRKGELVFSDEYRDTVGFTWWDFYPVPGDGIYYGTQKMDIHEGKYDVLGLGARKYSFETGEIIDIKLEKYDTVCEIANDRMWFSDDYIITTRCWSENDDEKEINIWDRDGNFVNHISGVGIVNYTGTDKDYVYFSTGDGVGLLHKAVPIRGGEVISLDSQGYLND